MGQVMDGSEILGPHFLPFASLALRTAMGEARNAPSKAGWGEAEQGCVQADNLQPEVRALVEV